MQTVPYKTQSVNKKNIQPSWLLINGQGKIVGRLASKIATLLRGKNKPYYTPHVDCGDYVIVTHAEEVVFSGKKETNKKYISHTGYPGGQKETTPAKLRTKHPTRILEKAVKGMLPKNRLGRQLFSKLKVYPGAKHPA